MGSTPLPSTHSSTNNNNNNMCSRACNSMPSDILEQFVSSLALHNRSNNNADSISSSSLLYSSSSSLDENQNNNNTNNNKHHPRIVWKDNQRQQYGPSYNVVRYSFIFIGEYAFYLFLARTLITIF